MSRSPADRYALDCELFDPPAVPDLDHLPDEKKVRPADDLGRFVAELYRHVERGELSFNYQSERERFLTSWHGLDVDDLAAAARRQAGNAWVPIGTRRERFADGRRGTADDVLDVVAFAVDLDVLCAHHARTDLPPTIDDAHDLLTDYPLAPTVITATGGGLQAWWMLAEPTPAADVLDVLRRWGASWRELGRRRGWHVDSTASLDHVFRLPGTTNTAAGTVVEIVAADYGLRYGLDDLDAACVEETVPPRPKPTPRPRNGQALAGDRYNATHTCDELIEREGCVYSHTNRDGSRHYFAPHRATSRERTGVTTYTDGHCAIWSETFAGQHGLETALEPDARTYDAFGLFAYLDHRGDFSAAARAYAKVDPPASNGVGQVPGPVDNGSSTPTDVDAETGEIRRAPLPDEFWTAHPHLEHIRDAAWARGRAPAAVLAAVMARVVADLDHRYVLPPTVGAVGSLNSGFVLIAPTGVGKSSSDAIAGEMLALPSRAGDPSPRGVPLGSGEGIAETYMGTRTATDEEKELGLAVKGQVREQMRWRELFIGDEGQAVMQQGKRNGSTLMSALRTMLTGGALGQQNAAADTRRRIPAHMYRAAVLLGFQVGTASELLDDADKGTPGRFTFVSAVDATIPAPGERPPWPGFLHIEEIPPGWHHDLERIGANLCIPVALNVGAQIEADDHARQTGAATGTAAEAHANLVRLRNAATLGRIMTGRPEVSDESWHLAGMVAEHSRRTLALIAETATQGARRREVEMSNRLADRAVNAVARTEAHRTVEAAKRIARKVREEPGITRSNLRRQLRKWRDEFDDGITHALEQRWITSHTEPGQGEPKHTFQPGEVRP